MKAAGGHIASKWRWCPAIPYVQNSAPYLGIQRTTGGSAGSPEGTGLLEVGGSLPAPRLCLSYLPLRFPRWERGTRKNLMSPYDIQEAFSCMKRRQVTGIVMSSGSSRGGGIQR